MQENPDRTNAQSQDSAEFEMNEVPRTRPKIDPTVRPFKIKNNISQLDNSANANYYSLPFWKNKIIYILAVLFVCSLAFIYWSVNRPETTIINDGNVNPVENTKSQASLMFFQGEVYLQKDGASWDNVNSSINLHDNDSIKTMDNSWAVIQFKNGALCRLDANTEIKILKADNEEIIIEEVYGQAYHYTNKKEATIAYTVKIQDSSFVILSDSFNTFNNRQSINAQIFSDSVQVAYNGANKIISTPTLININLLDNEIEETEITQESELFNYDWLNWNNQQNKLQGLALINIPLNENWPSEMSLDAKIVGDGTVEFTWEYEDDYEGEPPYGFYLIIGSEEDPSYPKNSYTHIAPDIEENKSSWENLADGEYHFRAGVFDGEKEVVLYSNDVKITLPEDRPADITLLGEIENNIATLTWTSENVISEDNWKIVIAENQTPTYPQNTNQNVNISANSYTWNNLSPNKAYQFRVCEYIAESDECRSYSNVIYLNTSGSEETPVETPSSVPLSINASSSSTSINISWSALTSGENYLLSINRAFGESNNIQISSSQSSYSYEEAQAGKTYFISMCRINNNQNCLERSNEVKITMPE